MAFLNVTNQTELLAALKTAATGDTITLASGNYGVIRTSNLASGLTIEAAADAKVQIDRIAIGNSHDMTIRNISIGSPLSATEALWTRMAEFNWSRNLVLDNVHIRGSMDGNAQNDGIGIVARNMDGFTVRNSDFNQLGRGMQVMNSQNVVVANNVMDGLEGDGVNFTAVQKVVVDGNSFTNFNPLSYNHPDAIQFWTTGQTVANTDITIRNNVLLQGAGAGPQGIFMRDEVGTLPYQNVVIENNLMYGADLWHGIAIGNVTGLRIAGNTVLSPNNDAERFWISVSQGRDVVVTKNVSDEISVGSTNVNATVSDNISLRTDPSKASLIPNLNAGALAKVSDLIVANYGYKAPLPEGAAAPAPVYNMIWGSPAIDNLVGTDAADRISGVPLNDTALGGWDRDLLTGRGGTDLFVLGDHRGAYYNDGSETRNRLADYGQVLDFQAGVDKIQLAGTYEDYVFRSAVIGGRAGLEIMLDLNGDRMVDSLDEVIGHVAGVTAPALDYFVFV